MFKNWMMKLLVLTVFLTPIVYADDCSSQFYNGQAPQLSAQLQSRTTFLCFEQYALTYSGVTRSPLWTAEYLTNNRVKEARRLKRQDSFHEEDRLPVSDRNTLKDFKGIGRLSIDRGHMSPNSDFSTYSAQFESFSLANIIAQDSNNNQILWEGIESATRTLATQHEKLFVVTGPIFDQRDHLLNGRIMIPTRIFKAIYDPNRKEAAAYIVQNAPGMDYEVVSIHDLERQIGINVFPGITESIKMKAARLPEPTPHNDKGGRSHSRHAANNDMSAVVERGLKAIFR
ncbi:DNA/RNA non-specific endonuclease [Undibacterium oligocarboniphilum]|uniref:DNA/RNA non-specific endonuclease n=1 Tax=Undibacterium oligocarboniphilum TaxID=666702 RepID=A0A850QRI3_9BURK|nr:DNA/RNA non-specific endonuclease [Undibacterium oligocarboniphilum]MBC3871784.1 DNA/RNA non-specific endonuclease [Undibacterium oligocarboniphilum]NVO79420.1 DNA/RNA non-specific endonuclease [Undibacterium oligocarboniphilum]